MFLLEMISLFLSLGNLLEGFHRQECILCKTIICCLCNNYSKILTGMATNASILWMCAISCITVVWTIQDRSFSSSTPNIIKKYWSIKLAIGCISKCSNPCMMGSGNLFKLDNIKFIVEIPVVEIPSCLQTTIASALLQKSSHTLPHWLLTHTSTLPSKSYVPDASRTGILGHVTIIMNNRVYVT